MQFGDNIKTGNITNSVVPIKTKIIGDLRNIINTAPITSVQDKDALGALLNQLEAVLAGVPSDRNEEANDLLERVKKLVEKATTQQPNKNLIKIDAEGLKQAAENLKAVTPTILTIATQIVTYILKMTGA